MCCSRGEEFDGWSERKPGSAEEVVVDGVSLRKRFNGYRKCVNLRLLVGWLFVGVRLYPAEGILCAFKYTLYNLESAISLLTNMDMIDDADTPCS